MDVSNQKKVAGQTGPLEGGIFWILWIYFGVKTFYFAFTIKENVFPDEASWFGMSELFSRSILPPVDSAESYPLGLITHVPNLYFFLMGKFLTLNVFPIDDLIFLRMINAAIGLLTIYFSWKVVRLLYSSAAVRLLFIVMLTNTIMYTFMFGAVSYDNLTNLCAVLSLYYMVSFFADRRVFNFLLFFLFLLAGALTKITFLPYAFSLVVSYVFVERRFLPVMPQKIKQFVLRMTKGEILLSLACLILLGANVNLYAGNKIKYGGIYPPMEKVLPVDAFVKNRLVAKRYAVNQFKAGKLSILEAQRQILQIRDPGDRANGWNELENAKREKNEPKKERMGRLQYTFEWVQYVFHRTYSIAAHIIMPKADKLIYPYYLVFMVGTFLFVAKIRNKFEPETGILFTVTVFYLLLLSQKIGYDNYLSSGFVGLSLTGRYLFPVIVPIYLLLAEGLTDRMPKFWQWGIGAVVGAVFIYGEVPWFLQNVTPNWYF